MRRQSFFLLSDTKVEFLLQNDFFLSFFTNNSSCLYEHAFSTIILGGQITVANIDCMPARLPPLLMYLQTVDIHQHCAMEMSVSICPLSIICL